MLHFFELLVKIVVSEIKFLDGQSWELKQDELHSAGLA